MAARTGAALLGCVAGSTCNSSALHTPCALPLRAYSAAGATMSSARAQAVCGMRVPHRARQARTASAAAQLQPPQQRAASLRVQACARPPVLRPGAPLLLNKGSVLAHPRGRVVARASDRDDEPVTATQEIPIFPLGLCAHPMGEGAGRGRLAWPHLLHLWWDCAAGMRGALRHGSVARVARRCDSVTGLRHARLAR